VIVKFWGVRGSIPSPGASTMRYGGNTACVSIDMGEGKILVLDAGTGIREMGKSLAGSNTVLFILLSHNHWDHIQGFPFFVPLYQLNRKIYIFPTPQAKTMLCSLIDQMDGAHFPVSSEDLQSQYACVTNNPLDFLHSHGLEISRLATNHPGGGYGYRIEHGGRSVVYLTDNEIEPPYEKDTDFDEFVQFCYKADVLIHDAQYLEQDMPHKRGWGHSLVSQACDLALAAEARHLILFHHDPDRTDEELDAIQEKARLWFQAHNPDISCTVAYEGLTLDV
jgi:phosphoribosyl 1,2-cyclic phosphodiesterase